MLIPKDSVSFTYSLVVLYQPLDTCSMNVFNMAKRDNEIDMGVCVECNGTNFEHNSDESDSCSDCGLVRDELLIDQRPNVSYGEDGTSNEHHGRPTNEFEHESMTTEIAPAYKGADGGSLSSKDRQKWGRLRFLDNRGRIRDGKERNLATALTELKRISTNMGLPNTIAKDGAMLYRKAVDKKLIRGRSIEGVVAASLYMSCRMNRNPRTLDDIGKHSRTGRKEIGRTYRFLARELSANVPLANPDAYIPRFCSMLGLGFDVQKEALEIISNIGEMAMVSRGPTGIAGAAIYLSAKRHSNERTQSDVAKVAGVTEVTIRNRYKELCETLRYDYNDPKISVKD
jgi:transcription initiation factor TFIIB